MKLYAVAIDYPKTFITVGSLRSRVKAEKLAFKLQEDPCYAAPDAKWAIETKDVTLWEWIKA